MSSPRPGRRAALTLLTASALSLGLGACFRPLYGPTASGASMRDVLASVEVEPIATAFNREYLGHVLRSELVFELDGSGRPSPKLYRLAISLTQSLATPVIDSSTGRANAGSINGDANYTLKAADGRVVASGRASGAVTYDRNAQRFASVRASREAEERLGKLLAEQIQTRLAAAIASGGA